MILQWRHIIVNDRNVGISVDLVCIILSWMVQIVLIVNDS
jgi:hypothetical protein